MDLLVQDVDTVPGRALRQKISHGLSLSDHVSLHTGWTIGERGGDAILTLYIRPPPSPLFAVVDLH